MPEEDNIITFRSVDFPVGRREKARCRCSGVSDKHPYGPSPSVWICEKTRDLECRECGARLDVFDYLWYLATDGESLHNNLKRMREEQVVLKAQNKLLEEQNRELRAEGRKLARAKAEKAPTEEIQAKVTQIPTSA